MRKTTLSICLILFVNLIYGQSEIINISDVDFKLALLMDPNINTNSDSEIQVTEANSYTGEINIKNLGISDLTGIEYFTNIVALRCNNNSLTNLNLTTNTKLRILECTNNNLVNLDLSANNILWAVYCSDNFELNNIILNASSTLLSLISENTNLNTLNISNYSKVQKLHLKSNNLTSLNISGNTNLKDLNCDDNKLTSINTSNNTFLEILSFNGNNIEDIDLTSNNALKELSCYDNSLTSLNLSANLDLEKINVKSNKLTDLDVSLNSNLTFFWCGGNKSYKLETLNIQNGNNTNMTNFNAYSLSLKCIFVDNKIYSNNNWTNIYTSSKFVETQNECNKVLSTDNFEAIKFKISPNPSSTTLSFNIPIKKIIIYNTEGKIILKSKEQIVNIESLSNGLYIIQIYGLDNNLTSEKFIKR